MTDSTIAPIPSFDETAGLMPEQLAALRARIVESLASHRSRVVHAASALEDFTSSDSPDDRESAREKLHQLLDGMRDHEEALARFDSGTYGRCGHCRGVIRFERLDALPEVNHCLDCAAEFRRI